MSFAYDEKWKDVIADVSDDEGETLEQLTAKDPMRAKKLLIQHQATALIIAWFAEAAPELPDQKMARIVRYVATGDRHICPDIVKRSKALAEFLAGEPVPEDTEEALLKLCNHAEKETNSKACSAEERALRTRAFLLCMDCLNHLGACKDEGGPAALAAELARQPDGELAARYEGYSYATALIRAAGLQRGSAAVAATEGGDGMGMTEDAMDMDTLAKAQDMMPSAVSAAARKDEDASWTRWAARHGGLIAVLCAFAYRYTMDKWYAKAVQ